MTGREVKTRRSKSTEVRPQEPGGSGEALILIPLARGGQREVLSRAMTYSYLNFMVFPPKPGPSLVSIDIEIIITGSFMPLCIPLGA